MPTAQLEVTAPRRVGCQKLGPKLRMGRFTGGTEFWHPTGARELTELLRDRCCIRFVLSGEDDGLAAADQMPRQRSTDVAGSDDCGCHGDVIRPVSCARRIRPL